MRVPAMLWVVALSACSSTSGGGTMLRVAGHPTPPGPMFQAQPAEYAAAWGAKEICSRVFVAGGDPAVTVKHELALVGHAVPGFAVQGADINIDRNARRATVSVPNQPARTAVFTGSQGCVVLPRGASRQFFEPRALEWQGPSAEEPWPLGEVIVDGGSRIDRVALAKALDQHMTRFGVRGVVVVHRGQLVGERYADGFGPMVPQRGWSTGKSVAATAIGRLVDRGALDLDAPAPVEAWRKDKRRHITLRHMINMSSGLDQRLLEHTKDFFRPVNEHTFIYVEGFDTLADAVEVPPGAFEPGTEFAYRNVNVLTATALARLAYAEDGGDEWAFIQREVFEPLGMRSSMVETDPYGNFLVSGAFYTTPRDLARLALVHLQGGVLGGKRVLSKQWADFAHAPSPGSIGYGAWWRNNLDNRFAMPTDAFFANGGFGQKAVAIPSRDLVIAQMGFDPMTDFPNFSLLVKDVVEVVDAIESRGLRD